MDIHKRNIDFLWQGTSGGMASGSIIPQELYAVEEEGDRDWAVPQSQHGRSSLPQEDSSESVQGLLATLTGSATYVQLQTRCVFRNAGLQWI